jgi:polar amino acid transport system substrate-binding protein
MHFYRLFFFASLFIFYGCSNFSSSSFRIGIDPSWYAEDFGSQTAYVNGYTEDLLLEMSRYSGMQFELVKTSWDDLLDGLRQKKYDAVITNLPRYDSHLAKYDFSENFLNLGPVLIVPAKAQKNTLEKLGNDLVGIVMNDRSEEVLAKYPGIIVRSYPSIPELLDAVAKGEIEGAVLAQIPALNYVSDLYANVLEISGAPLTDAGIHLVGPKGGINAFNKNLSSLRKKKVLEKLQEKWAL